jgi:hypothetical protein
MKFDGGSGRPLLFKRVVSWFLDSPREEEMCAPMRGALSISPGDKRGLNARPCAGVNEFGNVARKVRQVPIVPGEATRFPTRIRKTHKPSATCCVAVLELAERPRQVRARARCSVDLAGRQQRLRCAPMRGALSTSPGDEQRLCLRAHARVAV